MHHVRILGGLGSAKCDDVDESARECLAMGGDGRACSATVGLARACSATLGDGKGRRQRRTLSNAEEFCKMLKESAI